jgi:hypothetical protein
MWFVFFKVIGKAILSCPRQLRLQFLDAAYRIFSKTAELQLAQEPIPLAVVHMGKEHLSNCGAVKGHTRTNSRMDAQGLRRIKFFDVDRGETVADREMHSFSRTLI